MTLRSTSFHKRSLKWSKSEKRTTHWGFIFSRQKGSSSCCTQKRLHNGHADQQTKQYAHRHGQYPGTYSATTTMAGTPVVRGQYQQDHPTAQTGKPFGGCLGISRTFRDTTLPQHTPQRQRPSKLKRTSLPPATSNQPLCLACRSRRWDPDCRAHEEYHSILSSIS